MRAEDRDNEEGFDAVGVVSTQRVVSDVDDTEDDDSDSDASDDSDDVE